MNDMKIYNGNPYPQPIELQGSGQNVGQVGKTGASAGLSGKDNLTLVQGTQPKSETQTSGVNKHVLDLPRPTRTADLVGVDNALSLFLTGWNSSNGTENGPVDKNAVLKERRAENEENVENVEKQVEGETDLVIHQVMSNAEKVNNKIADDDAQINIQTNNARRENAEASAEKTRKAENKGAKIAELTMKVLSSGASLGASFSKNKKLQTAFEATGKALNVVAAGVKFAEISDEANKNLVDSKRKEAAQASVQALGAVAKYSTEKLCKRFDSLQKTLDAIVKADLDAQGQMPVTAN